MENKNQPTNQQTPPELVSDKEQEKPKKNLKSPKFLERLNSILANTKLPFNLPPTVKDSYSKIPKTLRIALLSVFGLLFLIIVIGGIASLFSKEKPEPVPLDVPTPAPHSQFEQGENVRPSTYATDSAILKFEQEINDLNKQLNELDLINPLLLPPELEFDINFSN